MRDFVWQVPNLTSDHCQPPRSHPSLQAGLFLAGLVRLLLAAFSIRACRLPRSDGRLELPHRAGLPAGVTAQFINCLASNLPAGFLVEF